MMMFRSVRATTDGTIRMQPGHEGINRVQWDLRGNSPEDAPTDGGFGFGGPQAPVAEPAVYRMMLTVEWGGVSSRGSRDVWLRSGGNLVRGPGRAGHKALYRISAAFGCPVSLFGLCSSATTSCNSAICFVASFNSILAWFNSR